MCGIVGVVNFNGSPVDKSLLSDMNDTLLHRGPDGSGVYVDGEVGLAHRRLSIIDLSGGAQPMSNDASTIWVTYNGEIYNFQEIRADLEKRGYQFHTSSDTEVLLKAYEAFGEDCVNYFRGMFAFAIWDSSERKLFLARDRIGEKPLYYYLSKDRLIFASEIKAILKDRSVQREVSPSALNSYLSFLYVPSPESIFENIYKLKPAHAMRVTWSSQGRTNINRWAYWQPPSEIITGRKEEDWVEELSSLYLESVKLRMISDVPVGAFLSGGVDSSGVVGAMTQFTESQIKTFSIGFKEEQYNELPYAKQVSDLFNTEWHSLIMKPDMISMLPKLAWQVDEPMADSSLLPTYMVSQLASQNVKVVLSGDGGDELFAGYSRYLKMSKYSQINSRIPGLLQYLLQQLTRAIPTQIKGSGALKMLTMSDARRYLDEISCFTTSQCNGVLDAGYYEGVIHDTEKRLLALFESNNGDVINKMQKFDLQTYLPEDILVKVDRMSMLNSLESRIPLLDHKLIEVAMKATASLNVRDGKGKYLLRQMLKKILPSQIMHRKKAGFAVPLQHWFSGDLNSHIKEILLDDKFISRGFFDRTYVRQLIKQMESQKKGLGPNLWSLLFFEHWCQQWLD